MTIFGFRSNLIYTAGSSAIDLCISKCLLHPNGLEFPCCHAPLPELSLVACILYTAHTSRGDSDEPPELTGETGVTGELVALLMRKASMFVSTVGMLALLEFLSVAAKLGQIIIIGSVYFGFCRVLR